MRSMARCFVVLSLLVVFGCSSVAGTWRLAPGQTPGPVSFSAMTLAEDNTFTAEAKYSDKVRVVSGFYCFKSGCGICFDVDGEKRGYGATLDGDELTIVHEGESVKMVRLRR